MPITITCDCGERLTAPDALTGSKARCVACGAVVQIPRLNSVAHDGDLWELAESEQREQAHFDAGDLVDDTVADDAPTEEPAEPTTFQPAGSRETSLHRQRRKKKQRKAHQRISYSTALLFPLTPSALLVIIADGTMLTFGAFSWFFHIPILGIIMQVFTLLAFTHLGIFLTEIAHFTALGVGQKARLPEIGFESLQVGYLWWLATLASLVPAGLAALILLAIGMHLSTPYLLALTPFVLIAAVYQPIAILGFAVKENLWGFHPELVLRAIQRLPGPLLGVTTAAGLAFVTLGLVAFESRGVLLHVSLMAFLWLSIYGSAVLMRIVGALYYNNAKLFRDWD